MKPRKTTPDRTAFNGEPETPAAEVIIEEPRNGRHPKPKEKKGKTLAGNILMLDLSQTKLGVYFLLAQALIIVVLLGITAYFTRELIRVRALIRGLAAAPAASQPLDVSPK